MTLRFEWDPVKAEANRRKHGVSFDTALRAFDDPFALSRAVGVEGGEIRWVTLGFVDGRILIVAHSIREEGGDEQETEIIRIISARRADRSERRRYEEEPR